MGVIGRTAALAKKLVVDTVIDVPNAPFKLAGWVWDGFWEMKLLKLIGVRGVKRDLGVSTYSKLVKAEKAYLQKYAPWAGELFENVYVGRPLSLLRIIPRLPKLAVEGAAYAATEAMASGVAASAIPGLSIPFMGANLGFPVLAAAEAVEQTLMGLRGRRDTLSHGNRKQKMLAGLYSMLLLPTEPVAQAFAVKNKLLSWFGEMTMGNDPISKAMVGISKLSTDASEATGDYGFLRAVNWGVNMIDEGSKLLNPKPSAALTKTTTEKPNEDADKEK